MCGGYSFLVCQNNFLQPSVYQPAYVPIQASQFKVQTGRKLQQFRENLFVFQQGLEFYIRLPTCGYILPILHKELLLLILSILHENCIRIHVAAVLHSSINPLLNLLVVVHFSTKVREGLFQKVQRLLYFVNRFTLLTWAVY